MPSSDDLDGLGLLTYFASGGTAIKIGKTKDLDFRLKKLQTGNPRKIVIVGVVPGDREGELHEMFDDLRLHGEWFKVDESIVTWVKDHGYVNVNAIEAGQTAA